MLSLLGCCLFRFYKKRRINKKAEINKKNFEDEQVLVYAEEEVDVLEEEAAKVGFILMLKKFEFSFTSLAVLRYNKISFSDHQSIKII